MKPTFLLLVCLWISLGLGTGHALGQQAAPPPAAAPAAEPTLTAEEPTAPPEPPAPERRRPNTSQVVAVGSDTHIKADQVAPEVVVVRGSALIEGDVDGDVVVVLGKVTVKGKIRGELVVVLGEAEVSGTVNGDTALILTESRIRSSGQLKGDLVAVGKAPVVDKGAKIPSDADIVPLGPLMDYILWARDYFFEGVALLRPFPPRLGWVWVVAGTFLAFHLLLAALFSQPLRQCVLTIQEQPARSFLVGLLACVLILPVSLLLSFTVVAPILLLFAFALACIFGRLTVYAAAGYGLVTVTKRPPLTNALVAVLLGSILFYVIYMVPLLGFLVYGVVLPWGVGAVLIRLFDALRRERRLPTPAPLMPGPMGGMPSPVPPTGGGPAVSPLGLGIVPPAAEAAGAATGDAGTVHPNPMSGLPSTATPLPSVPPTLPPVDWTTAIRVGFWPRLGASLIDMILIGFINAMTFGTFKGFWILMALYHLCMWVWKGSTVGGSVAGLRVVRLDGRPIDWPVSAVRVLGSLISLLPLGVGFLWASWDSQMQSWHDRIAGTTIVKADRHSALL